MHGLHCIADLQGCPAHTLNQHAALLAYATDCVHSAGLTVVAQLWHQFPVLPQWHASTTQSDGGITLTLLLAESHLCLHTWPELGSVSLDVYVCNVNTNNNDKARALLKAMIAWFEPTHSHTQELQRGAQGAASSLLL